MRRAHRLPLLSALAATVACGGLPADDAELRTGRVIGALATAHRRASGGASSSSSGTRVAFPTGFGNGRVSTSFEQGFGEGAAALDFAQGFGSGRTGLGLPGGSGDGRVSLEIPSLQGGSGGTNGLVSLLCDQLLPLVYREALECAGPAEAPILEAALLPLLQSCHELIGEALREADLPPALLRDARACFEALIDQIRCVDSGSAADSAMFATGAISACGDLGQGGGESSAVATPEQEVGMGEGDPPPDGEGGSESEGE